MKTLRKAGSVSIATVFAWMVAGVASAQTPTTTPAAPNTGVGGDPTMTLLVLSTAAVIAIAGIAYLFYRPADQY